MSKILGTFLLFAGLSWQQQDPLLNFCRRFGHQTAVVDQKLYIDGGLVDWNPISQYPSNYSNLFELYNDLTTSPPTVNMPQLYANLSKNASIPDVSGGVLWADDVNKRYYLYGGDYNGITPNPANLLSYDVIYNQWESFGPPDQGVQSVSWGGGVGISELGQGYMLGGWLSNNSVPNWDGAPLATSTLIKYDMAANAWTNNTGPDNTPRAEGVMVYIPASNDGLLIYYGGITTTSNGTIVAAPMSTIYVYDIQSSRWYTQTATGDVPLPRRRFCAGASWAQDHSSYNIYQYGGLGFGANSSGFDDVYILSLPSFTWIKYWQGDLTNPNPHNSLTCNVVNSGQMLVIGGTFPLSTACDSPTTWGTHNMDLGMISGKQWNDYEPNITTYVVPPPVISAVGGSSLGGATATAPAGGFNNSDLNVYFGQKASIAQRTPTRAIPSATNSSSSSSKPLPTGAIIGIAVGGAVILLALFTIGCCLIRRHRRKNLPQPPPGPYGQPDYSQVPPTPHTPYSPSTHYQTNSPYQENPRYQENHRYQLPAAVPVELAATNSYHQVDPKPQYQETQYPVYNGWREMSPPHERLSPQPQSASTFSEQTSPAPTYSSVGRRERKPVPANQTYYSP